MSLESVILYDTNDHSMNNYVSSVQEQFLIVALGPKSEARGYTLDHATKLIRQLRAVGREFNFEYKSG
jgi:hypothetical protein